MRSSASSTSLRLGGPLLAVGLLAACAAADRPEARVEPSASGTSASDPAGLSDEACGSFLSAAADLLGTSTERAPDAGTGLCQSLPGAGEVAGVALLVAPAEAAQASAVCRALESGDTSAFETIAPDGEVQVVSEDGLDVLALVQGPQTQLGTCREDVGYLISAFGASGLPQDQWVPLVRAAVDA